MEVGGIERSLLGLLNAIDYDKYDVDLFLWSHSGPFMEMIPSRVNILPEINEYALMDKPIVKMIMHGCLLLGCTRLMLKAYVNIRSIISANIRDTLAWYYHEYSLRFLPLLSTHEYDLAISFQGTTTFLDRVKADLKVGWVHTDYSSLSLDLKFMENVWRRADQVVAVSQSCRDVFVRLFPSLFDKLVVIENIVSPTFVKAQANVNVSDEMPAELGIFRLCTVGRYSHPKGFDRAILICKKLVERGYPVKWYAVGPPLDHPTLIQQIREAGVEENFILLGEKVNPYPYIAACDLYVQPSRFEGKAVTVREAQILGKPVVITNFSTAQSQLKDGYDGVIVPMDIDSCVDGLQKILNDAELRRRLSQNALLTDYSNEVEIEKIYALNRLNSCEMQRRNSTQE